MSPTKLDKYQCLNLGCSYQGMPEIIEKGNVLVGFILCVFLIFPGLLYFIFFCGYEYICPHCGAKMAEIR